MKVVVAIDSFKGSLTTFEAGEAICEGIKKVYKDAQVTILPMADGGEGTVDAIVSAKGGTMQKVSVCNPLGDVIESCYGIVGETAIIEMSAAAGITLIKEEERNPFYTTTFGVGEIILDAIKRGCRKFLIGIGGSATNDGGIGMLQALGFEFLNENGQQVSFGAKGLEELVEIKTEKAVAELSECSFLVACDVKNVLCGENGCSKIYGPQKGATPQMIKDMDLWLMKYADLTKKINPSSNKEFPGSGAAGGMGFALLSYLNAELRSGVELVINEINLEDAVKNSDIVITGEGRLDGQSYMGKAPIGVARTAEKYNKPVLAFSGCVTEDATKCNEYGIDAFFPILRAPCTLEEAMNSENAYLNLKNTTEQVFRVIKKFK